VHQPGDDAPVGSRRAPLRAAVIGVGQFGEQHVDVHAALGIEVVAVADRNADRARQVAQKHGVPRWYTDAARLFDECRPDGVSIAAHPAEHVDLAVQALDRGCHVLVEKPLALSPQAIDRLLDHPAGSHVSPGHTLRFHAAYRELRHRLRGGEFGRLLAVSASRDRPNWHTTRYRDIHPALMTAVHDIDLALWISGSRPRQVSALSAGRRAPSQVELITGQVRTADDGAWQLQASWLLPATENGRDRFTVYTEGGLATVIVHGDDTRLTLPSGETLDFTGGPDPLRAELAEFWRCVSEGVPPEVVTLEEARQGVAVAAAMIESTRAAGALIEIGA
jgi:predicted dehydrogenase